MKNLISIPNDTPRGPLFVSTLGKDESLTVQVAQQLVGKFETINLTRAAAWSLAARLTLICEGNFARPSPELNALLLEMKEYIENAEKTFDGEWGSGRTIDELRAAGVMPEIYGRILSALPNTASEPTRRTEPGIQK